MSYIDIVFDGPPGHESGRFVEVENPEGRSINAGEWLQRPDGYWVLRIKQDAEHAGGEQVRSERQRTSEHPSPAGAGRDEVLEEAANNYVQRVRSHGSLGKPWQALCAAVDRSLKGKPTPPVSLTE